MATLTEVVNELRTQNNTLDQSQQRLAGIEANFQSYINQRNQDRLQDLEDRIESRRTIDRIVSTQTAGPRGPGAGVGGGLLGGLLGGFAGAGMNLTKGAAGIAALGLAIPAFFGGLLAGDAALDWLNADLNFEKLKEAAIGFTNIILEMRPEAFIALAGIMGVSAVGGTKAAAGLGAMGFAISAFLGGLLAGDLFFSGVTALGGNLNFDGIKAAVTGVGSMIASLSGPVAVTFAAIMAASAAAGKRGAEGVGYMGFGISAFLAGLLAGDLLFEGVTALGANLDFANIKTLLTGFSSAVGALTGSGLAALTGLITAGVAIGITGKQGATNAAFGIAALGAGIGGLFVGLGLADASLDWMKSDFSNLPTAMANFSSSIENLSPEAMTSLAVLLGAGGLLGTITSESAKVKFVTGVSALSASIAAFFTGFAAMDAAARALGEGNSAKTLITNFGEAVSSLDENAIKILSTLIGAGGVLGAITAATGGVGAAVFAGIPALGASIAGFFLAFDGLATVADVVGVDGSNTKQLLINLSAGLKELTAIDFTNATAAGNALVSLSAGMAAFFAADALGKTVGFFESIGTAFKEGWNWFFGIEDTDVKNGPFAKIVNGLKPLNDLTPEMITKLNLFSDALQNVAMSFSTLANIKADGVTVNLQRMLRGVGAILDAKEKLLYGGTYRPPEGGFLGYQDIKFGEEGKGGLANFSPEEANVMREGIAKLYTGLGITMPSANIDTSNIPGTGANILPPEIDNGTGTVVVVPVPTPVQAPAQGGGGGGAYLLPAPPTVDILDGVVIAP